LATVFTLDPNKFAEKNQQRLLLGDRRAATPFISLHNQSSPVKIPRMQYDQTLLISSKVLKSRKRLPFPPDTNAFLYYFMPPEKTRIAGELRLRLTQVMILRLSRVGRTSWESNGQAWSRPLPYLPKYFPPLYEKLREEGFVPDDLDRVLSTLPQLSPQLSRTTTSFYFKWYIYGRLQLQRRVIKCCGRTRRRGPTIQDTIS
jgi:hypothetical protein